MDPRFSDYIGDLKFEDGFVIPNPDEHNSENPSLNLDYKEPPFEAPPDLSPNGFISPIGWSPEADPFAPSPDDTDSDSILKFISQILMEESADGTPQDSLALRATEKSLYEVLGVGGNGIPFINQPSLDDSNSTNTSMTNLADNHHSLPLQAPPPHDRLVLAGNEVPSGEESALHFQRGLEEATRFLPSGNQRENLFDDSRVRRNHEREDIDLVEGRSNKQSAVYIDESELSEMFDNVSLFWPKGVKLSCYDQVTPENKVNKQPRGSRSRVKEKAFDLSTLLMRCAQAVSSYNNKTANEVLKQIRQHSSPSGDGSQRLAHYFANGLEARLAGTATAARCFDIHLASKRTSAADVLKAYQLYLSTCPFMKFAIAFANRKILDLAQKAKTVHIVDFGIRYGFQWPTLIQHLARETATTPKLRITGIDLPQPGFRPTQGIEVAGRRLAKYCERFKVPFEFNAIASQNWETIQLEELKLNKGDTLVVSCFFQSKNLFGETVEKESPRDAFLSLIKEMSPDVFIHSITNGSYNSPFFITRFREALFHHSSWFDMLDTIMSREDQRRMFFEKEHYGREAMNVIACEGSERIERPETYKQWQNRTMDAGFRQLPLDREFLKQLRAKLKLCKYHNDFTVDEDSRWMLQGWKGRILYASSCWAPVQCRIE